VKPALVAFRAQKDIHSGVGQNQAFQRIQQQAWNPPEAFGIPCV